MGFPGLAFKSQVPLGRRRRAIILIGSAIGVLLVASVVYIGGTRHQQSLVTEASYQPQVVRLPDPEQDPRLVQIGVTWTESGYCYGQFHTTAVETAATVSVGTVVSQLHSIRICAGIGAIHNIAWADLSLKQPLGNRLVIRASDDVILPAIAPSGTLVEEGPTSADIEHYGGLNDNPPLAPRKSAHVTGATDLEHLVQQVNSLSPYPSQVMFCPFDDGSYYIVDFHYAAGGDVVLRIMAMGCLAVFLGHSPQPVAWAYPQSNALNIFVLMKGLLRE